MKWHDRAAVQCATGGGGWYRSADVDALLERCRAELEAERFAVALGSDAPDRLPRAERLARMIAAIDAALADGGAQ